MIKDVLYIYFYVCTCMYVLILLNKHQSINLREVLKTEGEAANVNEWQNHVA